MQGLFNRYLIQIMYSHQSVWSPRQEGKTRLIFHLSYDFPQSGNKSVNFHTPRDKCTVKYRDLDHAVHQSLKMLKLIDSNSNIWYGKTDVQSAFRILPLKPKVYWLLIMAAFHPITGKKYYFMDKCLPFGHSMSCALFQCFSDALAHLVKFYIRIKTQNDALWIALTNYLDDFLFAALTKFWCDTYLSSFLEMCKMIGVPVALEKTEWGTTIIIFLGVLMDGKSKRLGIPEEKHICAYNKLCEICDKKKATVKQLQQLTDLLNFLSRVIYP